MIEVLNIDIHVTSNFADKLKTKTFELFLASIYISRL